MNKTFAPWAHTGLVIGLCAGGFFGVSHFAASGESAYLNAAILGALLGYLTGLGLGSLTRMLSGTLSAHRQGETYG